MRQHRYYAEHHDTGIDERPLRFPCGSDDSSSTASAATKPRSSSGLARGDRLPDFVQPGPQAGDLNSLRFLAPRKLRRLDIDGPSPLALIINGRTVGIVRPGENPFDPPLPLEPGDTLLLEPIEPDDADNTSALSGWTPASPIKGDNGSRGGCHV